MDSGLQNTLGIPESVHAAAPVRNNVPEACMKEVMPCEILPLGFHLNQSIKERILKGEFVEILSLLPVHKDAMFKTDRKGGEARG